MPNTMLGRLMAASIAAARRPLATAAERGGGAGPARIVDRARIHGEDPRRPGTSADQRRARSQSDAPDRRGPASVDFERQFIVRQPAD
jgi:hypothetical protein